MSKFNEMKMKMYLNHLSIVSISLVEMLKCRKKLFPSNCLRPSKTTLFNSIDNISFNCLLRARVSVNLPFPFFYDRILFHFHCSNHFRTLNEISLLIVHDESLAFRNNGFTNFSFRLVEIWCFRFDFLVFYTFQIKPILIVWLNFVVETFFFFFTQCFRFTWEIAKIPTHRFHTFYTIQWIISKLN